MGNLPLVSIIIPVYNVEPYIERCLLSVLNQTYLHIEVIIVDDCTPDNSINIAEEVLFGYPGKNVRIIKHEENRGLSATRNTGIKAATGDYIYFLDSDDEIIKDAISDLVNNALNSGSDVVVGGIQIKGNYPEINLFFPDNYIISESEEILNTFFRNEWYVMACNKLINLSFLRTNSLFFYEGIYHEDLLWSFELAQKVRSISFCLNQTYIYYIRENSITGSIKPKNIQDYLFVYKRIVLESKNNDIILNNPSFENFIEGLRLHILLISDSKETWMNARAEMLHIRPISLLSLQFVRSTIRTKLIIFLQIIPSSISYRLFVYRKKAKA